MAQTKVVIIGSGFAGLAAASCLAQQGFGVTVLEKNSSAGGRARKFHTQGYTFDMGPSWYWMPEVFETFFNRFGKSVADYYELIRLDPSYQMIFSHGDFVRIPAGFQELQATFDKMEPGSGARLDQFLKQAGIKYQAGMQDMVYQPSHHLGEFINLKTLKGLFTLDIFKSFDKHLRKYFHDRRLIQMLSFPILFLGASAKDTPALYSLMNYADLKLGTWYPKGGMYRIVEAMVDQARSLGVNIHCDQEVQQIQVTKGRAQGVRTPSQHWPADVVLAGADYQHVESQLLAPEYRTYSPKYWEKRTMAPSSLIYYVGLNKPLPNLEHHNLFFDEDLDYHSKEIYDNPCWPTKPLFYVCATSKTDPTAAPPGHENIFILIPVAPGLEDTPEVRDRYFQVVIKRMENLLGEEITNHIDYCRSYAHNDFIQDYHAFKGNAYGLANTLKQTAVLKPKIRSRKVKNLFFTGQLTVPGPGVPPSLISGQVAAGEIAKFTQP